MSTIKKYYKTKNVGFISTRFAGTDGVSLETKKWADVFEKQGYKCFYFAGELDRPEEQSFIVPEAHFTHPSIQKINDSVFGKEIRDVFVSNNINQIAAKLKNKLYEFLARYRIGLIIPQNSLTIPLNIPLGVAITQLIMETGIPTIAHHHDFYWERKRFIVNAVGDYLAMAFPAISPSIHHVVINSFANEQLSLRTGISAGIVPNVMDFENPPPAADEYTNDVRQALGIEDDELFILQPTRVVKRKGIEHAIELVSRLKMKAKLVVSHASGDEGCSYQERLKEYSEHMRVKTIFVSDIISEKRGYTPDGRKIYTLDDIYPYADLVTYPSTFEGFGNAFLEAIYFKKPVVVNIYSVYMKDIKPKGFAVVELDGYVTKEAIQQTKDILTDPKLCKKIVEKNYQIATQFYSYKVLHRHLNQYIGEHLSKISF